MLLTQTSTPLFQPDGDMQEFYAHARRLSSTQNQSVTGFRPRQSPPSDHSRTPIRHKSGAHTPARGSRASPLCRPNAAAKQQVMAIFTDDWKNDIFSRSATRRDPSVEVIGENLRDARTPYKNGMCSSTYPEASSIRSTGSADINKSRDQPRNHSVSMEDRNAFLELMRAKQIYHRQQQQRKAMRQRAQRGMSSSNPDVAIPSIESDISHEQNNTLLIPSVQGENLQPLRKALRTAFNNSNMRTVVSTFGPNSFEPEALMAAMSQRREEMAIAVKLQDGQLEDEQKQVDCDSLPVVEAADLTGSEEVPFRNEFDEFFDLHAIEG